MEIPVFQKNWVILLFCFFCFPVGFILLLTNPRFDIQWRVLLICISVVIVLVRLLGEPIGYTIDHPFSTIVLVLPVLTVIVNIILSRRPPAKIGRMLDKKPDLTAQEVAETFDLLHEQAATIMASVRAKRSDEYKFGLRDFYNAQEPPGESATFPIHEFIRDHFRNNPDQLEVDAKHIARKLAEEWVLGVQALPPYHAFEVAINEVKSELEGVVHEA